jgi:hypothetical protein
MFYRQSRDLENTRVEQTCERINYLLFVRILKAPICYSHGNLVKTFIKFKFCEYHCQNLVLILVKVKAWKLNSNILKLTLFETSMEPKFWTKSSDNKIEFKTYCTPSKDCLLRSLKIEWYFWCLTESQDSHHKIVKQNCRTSFIEKNDQQLIVFFSIANPLI